MTAEGPVRLLWLRAAAVLSTCLLATACSSIAPSRSAIPEASDAATASPATTTASTKAPPSASVTRLEGRWTAGPLPTGDIKRTMIDFYGVSVEAADHWFREIGSPTTLAFSLEFTGNRFIHRWQVPGRPMEIGEEGTIIATDVEGGSGNDVLLSVGDGNGVDTYTLHFIVVHDRLSLHWVGSTEHGTTADQAMHRLFTIGFYCSAEFARAP